MKMRKNRKDKKTMRRRFAATVMALVVGFAAYVTIAPESISSDTAISDNDLVLNKVTAISKTNSAEGEENSPSEKIISEIIKQQSEGAGDAEEDTQEDTSYCMPLSGAYFAQTYDSLNCQHDIACDTGTPVVAVTDGTAYYYVSYGTDENGDYYMSYGKWVLLAGDDSETVAIYAHLSAFAGEDYTEISRTEVESETGDTSVISVREVQVKQGDVLGYVGETGNAFGPHLHFELYVAGERVNPTEYMSE